MTSKFVLKCLSAVSYTEEVTKSGSLLPSGKNSLLSKIGNQRLRPKMLPVKCRLFG